MEVKQGRQKEVFGKVLGWCWYREAIAPRRVDPAHLGMWRKKKGERGEGGTSMGEKGDGSEEAREGAELRERRRRRRREM